MEIIEIGARLGVGRRTLFLIGRPRDNFGVGAFRLRVGLDPFEDFPVALSRHKLLLQSFGIDAGKLEETLVQRAGVMIFAVLAVKLRAALVDAAWQQGVAAEADASAAG